MKLATGTKIYLDRTGFNRTQVLKLACLSGCLMEAVRTTGSLQPPYSLVWPETKGQKMSQKGEQRAPKGKK